MSNQEMCGPGCPDRPNHAHIDQALRLEADTMLGEAKPETFSERVFDGGLVVERIVHLDVQLANNGPLDEELIEWLLEDAEAALFPLVRRWGPLTLQDYRAELRDGAQEEALRELLAPLDGWLVEVSAPRIDWNPDTRSGRVHGSDRTIFICYADTYEAALEAAIAQGENHTRAPWDSRP